MSLQHIDEAVAHEMADRHGIDLMDGFTSDYPNAEYLLHELSHYVGLRCRFRVEVSNRMGDKIGRMEKADQDFHEAQTCAIELIAYELLGGNRKHLREGLIPYAHQGLRVYHTTEAEFNARVKRIERTTRSRRLAEKVVSIVQVGRLK